MDFLKTQLTIAEIASFIGLLQSTAVVVYLSFRARPFWDAGLAFFYFLILGGAFFIEMLESRVVESSEYFFIPLWVLWNLCAPVGCLLIIQMSRMATSIGKYDFLILLFPVLAYAGTYTLSFTDVNCSKGAFFDCDVFTDVLPLAGSIMGALCFLLLWTKRSLFSGIKKEKQGSDRLWLIFILIIMNIALLSIPLLIEVTNYDPEFYSTVRIICGLALAYLASTSLFRIYPQPFSLKDPTLVWHKNELSDEELKVAKRIEDLMALDKLYHEQAFSRADLAREMEVSEGLVSKVINAHFQKSFPQLMNEYRIKDAQLLLKETDASIQTVSQEVGFNSLATFNRVFKDIVELTPSEFRSSEKDA